MDKWWDNPFLNSWDWLILFGTLGLIVVYGTLKTRQKNNSENYLRGDQNSRWWAVGLSIMATQASAVTFLSVPGQAYADGMRFLQFYLGLPLAMIVLSVTAVPLYNRLKVYTAYQYLEQRFDVRTRTLTSLLFLIQRGLSTGLTIYAPSIVLATVLGWSLTNTILFIGSAVVLYTVVGGNRAVSVTHKQQMAVIIGGMILAGVVILYLLPSEIGLHKASKLAGHLGKMELLNLEFDPAERYNIWSGLIGGFFLQLSYFGTDQSQVARYLGGESVTQSRMGLLMNGIVKIPMQFFILYIGILVLVFFQFHKAPLFFNNEVAERMSNSAAAPQWQQLEQQHEAAYAHREALAQAWMLQPEDQALHIQLANAQSQAENIRLEARSLVAQTLPDGKARANDNDFIFITFVLSYLPHGLIGLLLAVIFSAAMSSTSSALTSLGSTTVIDIYQRLMNRKAEGKSLLMASRLSTLLWGVIAIGFALVAGLVENLIEAVNILGSLFYGTILGIFLVGFYLRFIGARAVFAGAVVAQAVVVYSFFYVEGISYLWYNVIGCLLVAIFAAALQALLLRVKGL